MSVVKSFPRLHIGLLDLGNATPRKYGGAGFALSGPSIVVQAVRSRRPELDNPETIDDRAARDLLLATQRLQRFVARATARIRILRMIPQHVGLGSKTALILGVLKAIDLEFNLGLSRETLQRLSGRGGTSGVGINAFFDGGFLVDGGHAAARSKGFSPSSARCRFRPPPIIFHCSIPVGWRFHLLLPTSKVYSAQGEVLFFERNTPITARDAWRSISVMYHAVAPAVLTDDLRGLRSALLEIHRAGFKKREVRGQSCAAQALLTEITESLPHPVGLSSMGPLIYVVASERDTTLSSRLRQVCVRHGAKYLGNFAGRNLGFRIAE